MFNFKGYFGSGGFFLLNYIGGLMLINGIDIDYDIDIVVGLVVDSVNIEMLLVSVVWIIVIDNVVDWVDGLMLDVNMVYYVLIGCDGIVVVVGFFKVMIILIDWEVFWVIGVVVIDVMFNIINGCFMIVLVDGSECFVFEQIVFLVLFFGLDVVVVIGMI